MAVPGERVRALLDELGSRREQGAVVGEVAEGAGVRVTR